MSGTRKAGSHEPRPRLVGTIGIVVGVLILVDKLDDLLLSLIWTEADWARWLGPESAELVSGILGSPWTVVAGLVGAALGTLLIVASVRLRQRRRSAVRLCRVWSWVAIGWVLVDVGVALGWLARHGTEVPGLRPGQWASGAGCGVLAALVLMLAFPVFLLTWLSRDRVRREYAGWAD